MEFLTKPTLIRNKLLLLIEECTSIQIAVAWATANHEVFKTLIDNRDKINKLVVGTHFFQTDPNFLEALERTKIPCCPPFTVLFVRLITFLVLVVAFGAEPFW